MSLIVPVEGLNVNDKKVRVANYHKETVASFVELMAAAGIDNPDKINRTQVYQRIDQHISRPFNKLYPYIPEGSLLQSESCPRGWHQYMAMADPKSFSPRFESVYIEED